MNIVICDDEKVYIDSIAQKVRAWAVQKNLEGLISLRSFVSSEDLLYAWDNGLTIDMLFIDLKIPNELGGLELAKRIRSVDMNMPIAFITNYSDYACDGYTVNALRYILKPVSQQPISDCLEIAYTRWLYMQSNSLKLVVNRQWVLLPFKEIVYVESVGHNLTVFTVNQDPIIVRAKLSDYENKLPEFFIKAHRSYIINIMYVRKIQTKLVTFADQRTVSLARSCSDAVLKAFRHYNLGAL